MTQESDRERVIQLLTGPRQNMGVYPWQEKRAEVESLGDRLLPTLASLLTDPMLGTSSLHFMFGINRSEGAMLIFPRILELSDDTQYHAFNECFLNWKDGPMPPFAPAMHDAAVACLNQSKPTAIRVSLLALGYVGSQADFPLIRRFLHEEFIGVYGTRHRFELISHAVLGRLGEESSLRFIEEQLQLPLPTPFTEKESEKVNSFIRWAAFTKSKLFIKALCRHLDDPPPTLSHPGGCMLYSSPAQVAAIALDQIVNGASWHAAFTKVNWKKWRDDHPELSR